jgi:hypothetical protein
MTFSPGSESSILGPWLASPSRTRGGSRAPESGPLGYVRGALSNGCPYRDLWKRTLFREPADQWLIGAPSWLCDLGWPGVSCSIRFERAKARLGSLLLIKPPPEIFGLDPRGPIEVWVDGLVQVRTSLASGEGGDVIAYDLGGAQRH